MSRENLHPRRTPAGSLWQAALLLSVCATLAGEPPLRWRWSNPAPHGGNISAQATGLGLTVQVCEQGQIFTSEDLSFWEPRESHTTRSLRGVTFLRDRLIITGEAGLVLHADSLEDFRTVQLNTTDWLESVAASAERVVAVGDNGAIYTSTNGTDWTRQITAINNWLRGVTFGCGSFVAVGENGLIATSSDGLTWVIRNSGTSEHLNAVACSQNRLWVAGNNGTTLMSQNGGQTWTQPSTGATGSLFGINVHPTGAAVVGDQEVRYLHGTPAWQNALSPETNPAPIPWTYLSALWLDTFHLIAGRSGMIAEGFQTNSSASLTWVTRHLPIRNWLWEIRRTPEFYVTVGYGGTIMTSTDGIDWNLELVPASAFDTILLGVGGTTNLLLAVGENGTILTSPNTLTNIATTGTNGTPATNTASTLGIFWHDQPQATTAALQGVSTFNGGFVVCGASGTIMTSANGTQWTAHPTPTTHFLTSITEWTGGLVAAGQAGTILTSPDGIDWTGRTSGTTNWIYRVRTLDGRLIAVGQNGTLLVSTNGIDWSPRTTGTTEWVNDITLMDQTYFATGNRGTLITSTNLIDWLPLDTITRKSLYGIAHHDGQLILAGIEGALLRAQVIPVRVPIDFAQYSRTGQHEAFLLTGEPGQRFTIDQTADFATWRPGPTLEFLDSTGTLLYLRGRTNQSPAFYRTTLVP